MTLSLVLSAQELAERRRAPVSEVGKAALRCNPCGSNINAAENMSRVGKRKLLAAHRRFNGERPPSDTSSSPVVEACAPVLGGVRSGGGMTIVPRRTRCIFVCAHAHGSPGYLFC